VIATYKKEKKKKKRKREIKRTGDWGRKLLFLYINYCGFRISVIR
jgi:hypothetical protein